MEWAPQEIIVTLKSLGQFFHNDYFNAYFRFICFAKSLANAGGFVRTGRRVTRHEDLGGAPVSRPSRPPRLRPAW